jgi:hypothetical protein
MREICVSLKIWWEPSSRKFSRLLPLPTISLRFTLRACPTNRLPLV